MFTVDGKKPSVGHQRLLKSSLYRLSGVSGWVVHDFRRTLATGMAKLGVAQDTIERILGHARPGLAGVYNRHEYLEEKRRALLVWAEHVRLLVSDDPKVVALPTRR